MLQINFNQDIPIKRNKMGSIIEYYLDDDKPEYSFKYIVQYYSSSIDSIEASNEELEYIAENFSGIKFGPAKKNVWRGETALFILENWE